MPTPSFSRKGAARTILLVALIVFFLCPLSASAQCTSTWSGGASGSWNTVGNWTPSGVPTSSSNTCINTANSSVTISTSSGATENLTLGVSTDSLIVANGQDLSITAGGNISNAGTLTLSGTAGVTSLNILGATTLSGSGTLTMSNVVSNPYIQGGGTLTNEQTIQGSGIIGNGNLTLINSGVINANQSSALTINPNGGTTNSGILEATAGGTLDITNVTFGVYPVLTNTGAGSLLSTGAGSTVNLINVTVNGGTLTTSSGGVMTASGVTFNGITISSGSTLQVYSASVNAGTLTNNGTISLPGSSVGDYAILQIDNGGVTLTGGGNVTLSGGDYAQILAGPGGATLTNVNNTISGSGEIGNNSGLSFVNEAGGIVDATANAYSLGLSIAAGTGSGVGTTNLGLMEASSGGTLELEDTVTNIGGTIEALAGGTVSLTEVDLIGGTLTSVGTGVISASDALLDGSSGHPITITSGSNLQVGLLSLQGSIVNNGTIALDASCNINGCSSAYLNIVGPVTLNGSGTVTMSMAAVNANIIQGSGTLTNQQTIQGEGTIGNASSMTLVNSGTINSGNGDLIIINPSGGTTNTGTLEATAGGQLELENYAVTNTGGTILATGSNSSNGSGVQLSGVSITGGTLTTNSGGVISAENNNTLTNLTISTGSTLIVPGLNTLNLGAGTITNNGTITLGTDPYPGTLSISGNVTLAGTGKVIMTANTNNSIQGTGTLTNESTIEGEGDIGYYTIGVINTGTIAANETGADTPSTLFIETSAAGFSNSSGSKNGTLSVSAKNTLIIEGGPFKNFNGGTLTGGIYKVTGTLEYAFGGTGIVTNDANITLTSSTGEIYNTSTGTNALSGFADNASGGSFTIASGRNFTTAGAFSNAGIMVISKGTTFTVGGTNSYTQTAGTTTVSGSLVVSSPGAMKVSGGSVFGTGTITGNIDLTGGLLSPGAATKKAGELTVSGNYTESGTAILNIDLDGTTAGTNYDVLNISGKAALGGTLDVDAIGSFKPTVGQQYDILDYGSKTGKFTTVDCTFSNGDGCTITYNSTGAVLTITAPAAPAPASLSAVNGTLPRWTRSASLIASGAGVAHETSAILTPAETCSGLRTFASFACLARAFSGVAASAGSALHSSAGSERASATATAFTTLHNNVAATTSGSGTRRAEAGAPHAPDTRTSSSASLARLYLCAYLPSDVASTMGCR